MISTLLNFVETPELIIKKFNGIEVNSGFIYYLKVRIRPVAHQKVLEGGIHPPKKWYPFSNDHGIFAR